MDGIWTLDNLPSGDGPVVVGYAHSDYSVTEIKEALEAGSSISVGNMVSQEHANRLVRKVGTFVEAEAPLNNGMPIKTRLNWLIPIGKEVNVFAFNDHAADALATGSILTFNGNMWVKDSS